jgi:uncharacterized phage protein (TIGR01671 family)
MRPIKFRVWAKEPDDDGCVGYLETRSPVAAGIDFFYDAGWRGLGYFLRFNNFIVQQFTGIKDFNGNEIYEGDIVSYCDYRDNYIYSEVFFGMGRFYVSDFYKDPGDTVCEFIVDESQMKVLGNILENENLLLF